MTFSNQALTPGFSYEAGDTMEANHRMPATPSSVLLLCVRHPGAPDAGRFGLHGLKAKGITPYWCIKYP